MIHKTTTAATSAIFFAIAFMMVSPAQGYLKLYEHDGYKGEYRTYHSSNSNIGSIFNDKATSARVTGGQRWILYEHDNYKGRSVIVSSDVPNLGFFGDLGNDKVTSVLLIWWLK